ncbi:hypothetical protein [Streptomyces sp. NPDC058424]|uniref:hypothetical protein n=1 Tax=Streptomyces sp. NPDC058424 TaxID=3346491 RepID=UPI003651E2F6
MSTLDWRTADVDLSGKLIPNPLAEHQLLDRLNNVRVAIDSGFLHIDPRPNGQPAYPGQDTYPVHIVPAHSVRCVTYKEVTPEDPKPAEVQIF